MDKGAEKKEKNGVNKSDPELTQLLLKKLTPIRRMLRYFERSKIAMNLKTTETR